MPDAASHDDPSAISFGAKLVSSSAFKALFREGMALVEETASYLDGPGRKESKKLERIAALTYATESMRLTTRLMQLASWLLLHRAVKEGEMSLAQASKEKSKVKLAAGGPNGRVSVLVSSGEAEIGLQQVSELQDNPGVEVVGMLPAELQQITIYSAGITAIAKEPDAARALIKQLTSPEALALYKTKGLGL